MYFLKAFAVFTEDRKSPCNVSLTIAILNILLLAVVSTRSIFDIAIQSWEAECLFITENTEPYNKPEWNIFITKAALYWESLPLEKRKQYKHTKKCYLLFSAKETEKLNAY